MKNPDTEIMKEYQSWFPYAEDVITLIHPKHFYFVAFPLEGGYYDQPFRLMQILNCMREVYIRKSNEMQEREMKKIKNKRR